VSQQGRAQLDRTREELESANAENQKLRQEDNETKRQYLDLLDTSANRVKELQAQLSELQQRLDTAERNPPAAIKLPSPADLLNQLKKANGKKFTASLTDVEKILESLGVEES
jgi:phosphoglycolate phosphatase-like HAD superfamily hydrolase